MSLVCLNNYTRLAMRAYLSDTYIRLLDDLHSLPVVMKVHFFGLNYNILICTILLLSLSILNCVNRTHLSNVDWTRCENMKSYQIIIVSCGKFATMFCNWLLLLCSVPLNTRLPLACWLKCHKWSVSLEQLSKLHMYRCDFIISFYLFRLKQFRNWSTSTFVSRLDAV